MIHNKPLKTFNGYGGQGYRAIVIHGSRIWLFGQRYDGGTFKTDGHSGLSERDIEYVYKDVLQPFSAILQHTAWDVIWTSSLLRVDVGKYPLHAVGSQLQCLVGRRQCPPLCHSVVCNLKPGEKGIEVIW